MEDFIETYKVYIKTDDNANITAVNSSAFLADMDGWTLIGEGTGDRYHHAQGNYLERPLMDDAGHWNYKLVDGSPAERTDAEKSADITSEDETQPTIEERMETVETITGEIVDTLADALGATLE